MHASRPNSETNPLAISDLSVAEAGFRAASERRAGRVQSHLTWAAGGFIIGVVFWHLLGFWTLVAEVIGSTPETATLASVLLSGDSGKDATPLPTDAGRHVAERSNCTALVIDRKTGETYSRPCQPIFRARIEAGEDERTGEDGSRWPLLSARAGK